MRQLKKFFKKIKKKLPYFDEANQLYVLAGLVFVTGIILLAWFAGQYVVSQYTKTLSLDNSTESTEQNEDCKLRRRLDGVCVDDPNKIDTEVVAVMIENSADAWPISGLDQASVVYEAPVEGNIPRYMAIFSLDDVVDTLGPVRSARPYYLDWLSEYGNAMYMHVGGSPESLERLDNENIFNINEMTRGQYYWRSAGRRAPHNTYTSNELWLGANQDYARFYDDTTYDGWLFESESACEEDCGPDVLIQFGAPIYNATWAYSKTSNKYIRTQGNNYQITDNNVDLVADTVVVQRVRSAVLDSIGRKRIDTVGNGEVMIFKAGQLIEGTWEKLSLKDRTKFYDKDGDIIPLQPGKIWIEVVPETAQVVLLGL